jgi:hypothetical protein
MDFGGVGTRKGLVEMAQMAAEEKIGVPRVHGNMIPGNSFPQICVVSVNIKWKSRHLDKIT